MKLRLPDDAARPVVLALVWTWVGVSVGRSAWWWLAPTAATLLLFVSRERWAILAIAAIVAGTLAGLLSISRERAVLEAVVPAGRVTLIVTATMDPAPGEYGEAWLLARPAAVVSGDQVVAWQGPPILVSGQVPGGLAAGEQAQVVGRINQRPGWARGTPYAARVSASSIAEVGAASLIVGAGNTVRNRVVDQLGGDRPAAALLAGFLVGATNDLPEVDYEALRRSGLAHFVAVSGSNVAGFLLLWWLALGPIGLGRRRGILGLAGLVLFVVATRWEPSVVRASLMAGTVLAGRVVGWPIDSWTALGASGTLALLVSPELSGDLGFQLSVLATAGILAGHGMLPETWPAWLRTPLGATLSAQVAVLPLLLAVFGSVPLLSPVTNLMAAPMVAFATMTGGIGTILGLAPVTEAGVVAAGAVLVVARAASSWPQVGPLVAAAVVGIVWMARSTRWRPLAALAAALAISGPLVLISPPPRLAAVFLDVGQGDSTLLLGASGQAVLVDGGPNPVGLMAALERYRVEDLALVVVTHAHEDHAGGIAALPGRRTIGQIWYPGGLHSGESWEQILIGAVAFGIPVEVAVPGMVEVIDGMRLEVLGPLRRYEGINDQSVVLWVEAGGASLFLTGDIEVAAQRDLGPQRADVLKVPHHGGSTSDLDWLAASMPRLSIVSVGENDYGHPSPEVLEVLSARSVVVRTDLAGDIVVPLTGDPLRMIPVSSSGRAP
ncbi:MAG TPA: ComEC/Rec2 family competence protein [Acidimicrobiia bacterium]|nr:ComEC/Rec2 family competence protein [Acidimicrobiia bacterium]